MLVRRDTYEGYERDRHEGHDYSTEVHAPIIAKPSARVPQFDVFQIVATSSCDIHRAPLRHPVTQHQERLVTLR